MDRLHTVMGWRFAQWAYVAALYHRAQGKHQPANLLGANALRAYWDMRFNIVAPGERPTSAEHDFAWASRMFSNALIELQLYQNRANVGQEKGADDYQSPTP